MGKLQHHLVVTVASVALLCVLQGGRAMPNPEFGANGNGNPGRNEVAAEATHLGREFGKLDDTQVTLDSGYTLLDQVKAAVLSIGSELEGAGTTLAQRLHALARHNGPNNVNMAFEAAFNALNALKTLMASGLNGQLSALRSLTGPSMPRKFRDAFQAMREALERLAGRLHALREVLDDGRPSKVSVRVQNAVAAAIRDVSSRLGAVRYMVRSTLHDLATADEFLEEVTEEAKEDVAEMQHETLHEFSHSVHELMEDVLDHVQSAISCVFAPELSGLPSVMAELSSVSSYAEHLQGTLQTLSTYLSSSALSSVLHDYEEFFHDYHTKAVGLQSNLESFFQTRTCEALEDTMLVLVAGGPYNRYCFHKHSDRVYNLYDLYFNAASKCYEVEYYRLTTLADALEDLVDLVLYDVEELVARLNVCVHLRKNKKACVTTLGKLYKALVEKTQHKVHLFLELTEHELDASYNRLAACVASARYGTLNSVRSVLRSLKRCKDHGEHEQSHETHETNETNEST